MAKHKRHARRRNPTGTILVNPRRGGARRHGKDPLCLGANRVGRGGG